MGDSDDENYDRRRSGARDKFRRERNDYERQDDRRGGGGRDQWEDRGREGWNSRNRDGGDRRGGNMYNRDYDNSRRRERYSPQRHDMSPPQKRMRRDWDEGGGGSYGQQHHDYGSGYNVQHGNPQHHGGGGWGHSGPGGGDMPPPQQHHYGGGPRGHDPGYQTQPPLITFKAFLAQQDDNITDEEAIKKFNEYKIEFKKIQINEFFLAHKEEEWFRSKYHPEECGKRRLDQRTALKQRASVFMEQFERGKVEALSCDLDKSEELIKLLDTAVIKMEGGTDFDLQILESGDWPAPQQDARTRTTSESTPKKAEPEKTETPTEEKKEDNGEIEENEGDKEDGEEKKPEKEKGEEEENEDKEKEEKEPVEESKEGEEEEELKKQAEEFKKEKEKAESENEKKKKKRNKGEYDDESDSGSDSDSSSESDSEPAPPGVGEDQAGAEGASGDKKSKKEDKKDSEKEIDTKEEKADINDDPCPRALHRTTSIFLRNLAPSITKQEVEAMCKRYPGFMRVALQDPQPERQFFRRGWVTFDHTVNIKDICWNLNNIRLRECEMGAIVNRELKQRVRPINGIASHKQVVRADIKHAAKIIQNLDDKWNLWEENDQEKKDREKESFGLVSKNPVLKNITDYLVEEGSYEEEELLGTAVDDKPKEANPEVTIERDEELIKVLDRMILYLRIVHSYDFYSAVEYPNEDEMPHRCGIIHARGPVPPNRVTQQDVNDWLQHFEQKVSPALDANAALDEHEAAKLGHKDIEVELEKFVTANTQELAKDKWLCPLSGKKFKGPEFVRKHIFNKHAEKVEEVKQEVAFFNNYLMDPKRPQLQEHPGNRGPPAPQRQDSYGSGHHSGGGGYHQGPPQQQMMGGYSHRGGGGHQFHGSHHAPYQNYQSRGHEPNYRQDNRRRDSFPPRNRERGRPDPRGIIEYRDLDAPDDVDIF